ncbi:hypothetical protein [Clostridium sp. BL8]|nr:hypothetical protein [Clostridium sp. BL8]
MIGKQNIRMTIKKFIIAILSILHALDRIINVNKLIITTTTALSLVWYVSLTSKNKEPTIDIKYMKI